jgi:transposase InsO family protein
MAYTSNPFVMKTRRLAVNEVVVHNRSVRDIARRYGVHRATLYRWIEKASPDRKTFIRTLPSTPKSSPNQLTKSLVNRILELRKPKQRCAEVIQHELKKEGLRASVSSIKRVISRHGLSRKPKQLKSLGTKFERPHVFNPGDLVEMDTIHYVQGDYKRFFLYTAIDLYSRFAYAEYCPAIFPAKSVKVVVNMVNYFSFTVRVLQTDNGQEFGEKFKFGLDKMSIRLRHIRVGKPNDNAHIERFNRSIQEECFSSALPKLKTIDKEIAEYLKYYNFERPHLSLQCMSPREYLSQRC